MHKRILSILLGIMILVVPIAAMAGMHDELEHPDLTMEVMMGYDGLFVYGKEMPAFIHIENRGEALEGRVAMNAYASGTEYNRYETEVSIPAGSSVDIVLPLTVLYRQEKFTAELLSGDRVLCAKTVPADRLVNPNAMLVGVLSDDPQALTYLNITAETDELYRGEYWQTLVLDRAHFPETQTLLNSMGILVIDGFDVSELNTRQREALDAWLRSGHIAVLGGGAKAQAAYAGFEEVSGIRTGSVQMHPQVSRTLLEAMELKNDGADLAAVCCSAEGGECLIADDAGPLVLRSSVDQGKIYAMTFSLTEGSLARWGTMHTLLQRLFLQFDSDQYSALFNNYSDSHSMYLDDYLPIPSSSDSLKLALAVLGGFLVLIPVAYWILRKLDKRTLLWIVYPVLAMAAVAGIAVISSQTNLNRPAVIVNNQLLQDAGQKPRNYTTLEFFAPEKGAHTLSVTDAQLRIQSGGYWYDEDSPQQEPVNMRYRVSRGAQNTIGMNNTQIWQSQSFVMDRQTDIQGQMEAEIWMEEDGLHGLLRNDTNVSFHPGGVFTRMGFCRIPALAPGEEKTFVMRWGTFKDPKNPVYEDGVIYTTSAFSDAMSEILCTYVYGQADVYSVPKTSEENLHKLLEYQMLSPLVGSAYAYTSYRYGEDPNFFYYAAEIDNPAVPELLVDGRPCERVAGGSVAKIQLKYLPVGKTGVVYHMGSDHPTRVEIDTEGYPEHAYEFLAGFHMNSGYSGAWYALSETPTFGYDLSDVEGAELTGMRLSAQTYVQNVTMSLLNPKTGTWVEQTMKEPITDPERYIGPNGILYVQFRTDSSNQYAEIQEPMLILEGRMM